MRVSSLLLLPVAGALIALAGCGEPSADDRQKAAQKAIEKGDHAAALIELKSALQTEPSSGALRFSLASLLLDSGDALGAVVELKKAVESGYKRDVVTARLASALVAAGKYKEVTDSFGSVTLSDPASQAELGAARAAAWFGRRSAANARAAAMETLKSSPEYGPALLVLARLAAIENKIDDALSLADRAVAKGSAAGEAHLLRAFLLSAGKRDRAGAQAAFEQAAKVPSTSYEARAGLFQLHLGGRDIARAKSEFAILQKLHPKRANTLYLAAVLAYSEGKLDQVEARTDALLKLAPDNAQFLTLAGAGHLRRGALVAAESKLGRVVQTVDRAPLARKLLADTYLRMGQPDKALATLSSILSEADDADAMAMAAQAYLQKGQLAEAEASYSAALKVKPDDIRLRTSMALTGVAKGDPESAFDALKQLAAQDSGNIADLALISELLKRKDFDRSLAAIDQLEKKQPAIALPRHLRGLALLGKSERAGARKAFEAALNADPAYFASTAMLASLDTSEKNYGSAQGRLEAALKLTPANLGARMALVDVLRAKGASPAELLQAINEAVRLHPTEAAPHLAKLAYLGKVAGVKEAAGHAQVALAALPDNPKVLDAAGLVMSAAGDEQQALSAFSRLVPLLPKSPLPYLRMSDVYVKRGNRAEASAMLNRGFEVAPESAEVHRRLLEIAERTKDYKSVLAAAKDLQRRFPQSSSGHMLEGAAQSLRKAWPEAALAYRSALAKPDGNGRVPRVYYTTLKRAGAVPQAQKFALDWLKANPKDTDLRSLLGSEAIVAGRHDEAMRLFREIIEIEPRSPVALNNLAALMAQRGHPDAVATAERALALAPASSDVLDTVAKAHEAAGNFPKAVEFQRRATGAPDAKPAHRLDLARLLVKSGDRGGAVHELDQLAALGAKFGRQADVEALRKGLPK